MTARNLAFEPAPLVAQAGPLVITFRNRDDAIPHALAINDASGATVFEGEPVLGPVDVDYPLPAVPPGSYTYACTVHPTMTGTLTILP